MSICVYFPFLESDLGKIFINSLFLTQVCFQAHPTHKNHRPHAAQGWNTHMPEFNRAFRAFTWHGTPKELGFVCQEPSERARHASGSRQELVGGMQGSAGLYISASCSGGGSLGAACARSMSGGVGRILRSGGPGNPSLPWGAWARVHPGTEPPQLMESIPKNAKLDVQKNNDYVEGGK